MTPNNNGNGIGKCGEYLRYEFTRDELEDKSKELARHTLERGRLEQNKKEVDSQLKAQIEAETSQIALLAGHINMGHESRMIDCAILWHNPKNGRATICRIDTGEVVRERAMTYDELQDRLPFHNTAETTTAAPSPEPEPDRRPVAALIGGEVQEAEFVEVPKDKQQPNA